MHTIDHKKLGLEPLLPESTSPMTLRPIPTITTLVLLLKVTNNVKAHVNHSCHNTMSTNWGFAGFVS